MTMDLMRNVRRATEQVEEFFNEVIRPILEEYRVCLSIKPQINVSQDPKQAIR